MSEETMADDSSHYEVSLTAGQAFVGFVLLLFSLAAAFMFGVMIGKGQAADRLVVKRDPTVVAEASTVHKVSDSRIVELGVPQSDSQESVSIESEGSDTVEPPESVSVESGTAPAAAAAAEPPATEIPAAAEASPATAEAKSSAPKEPVAAEPKEVKKVAAAAAAAPNAATQTENSARTGLAYAQLLSTAEAKTAENLAAKLIDAGFTSAYVERSRGESGMIYRVRVKFASDVEARAAADRLRTIAKTEPWITRQ